MDRRLELISEMTLPVWIHLIVALLALVLGALVLWRRKGDRLHKFVGRVWVGLMMTVAVSSFFITEIRGGNFSPIHLLSLYTIGSLSYSIAVFRFKPRADAIRIHRTEMRNVYIMGLVVAGGFTLLPHRLLGRLITEASIAPHVFLIGICLIAGVVLLRWSPKLG